MSVNVEESISPTDATAPAADAPDRSLLSPRHQATAGVTIWGDFAGKGADADDVHADLKKRTAAVQSSDMRPIEAALLGQAETLGTMFTNLHLMAKRSTDLERMRTLLTLTLKAQAQSRATMEALIEAKHPRQLLIARQANIAQQQVVSNGPGHHGEAPPAEPARTKANVIEPNELLEGPHEFSLDTRASSAPVDADPRATTLGAVDRATNTARQSRRVKKRVQGRDAVADA